MDTKRPVPLDLAARDRATRRVHQLTTGVAATTTSTTTIATDTTSGTASPAPTLASGVAPGSASGPGHVTTGGS